MARTMNDGPAGTFPISPVAQAAELIDRAEFQDVIGRFASGVTVVTTHVGERDYGTTASAVSSLSLEPPMLLICLNETSETQMAIRDAGRFAVNILSDHQSDVASRFATKSPSKFRPEDVVRARSGLPLIAGALAQIECRVTNAVTGGTHTVFLAEVEHAAAIDAHPLTYYRGRFGRFEDVLDEAAYRQLRGLVLSREWPIGEPLDVGRLAAQLELEEPRVFYALTKLMTDGLITRQAGDFAIIPLDTRSALQALEARCMIEVAVAETVAGQIDDHEAQDLRLLADAACQSVQEAPPDLRALARAAAAFHERFVGLLGNDVTSDFYRRLQVESIWLRALRQFDGPRYSDPRYLRELVDKCVGGDADGAKRVVLDHAEKASRIARDAIERAGGVV
jgi:flavin reductase (DIM6/NTAB) family NADH-FMN oxidoreductase RutF/DNA-binding GntR family transcriptional regulator